MSHKFRQIWKLKNEMSSRRDDEIVLKEYIEEEQRRNRSFLSFFSEAGEFSPASLLLVVNVSLRLYNFLLAPRICLKFAPPN